jgi:hypothetical protein
VVIGRHRYSVQQNLVGYKLLAKDSDFSLLELTMFRTFSRVDIPFIMAISIICYLNVVIVVCV